MTNHIVIATNILFEPKIPKQTKNTNYNTTVILHKQNTHKNDIQLLHILHYYFDINTTKYKEIQLLNQIYIQTIK